MSRLGVQLKVGEIAFWGWGVGGWGGKSALIECWY